MRPSRLAICVLGFVAGVAAVVAGVGYLFGLGPALIAGGVIVALSFLLLANVDETTEKPAP